MQLHRVMMCFRVRTVIINTEAGLICFLFFLLYIAWRLTYGRAAVLT